MNKIDLTKIIINSSTPGLQQPETFTFSYSVPSQTLTTGNQQYTQTNTFSIEASFNEIYGQFQMPGLDSTWRVLNGGTSYYNYTSAGAWALTGTNAYSVRLSTQMTSNGISQTLLLQYQNSPNNVTVPAFTVNLKIFVIQAPF
jgi:hypothetical protein